ncbi:MAG TPA: dihydrolipoyllysine-residue acetyltransferase [Nevskiaceae bacterium]
MADTIEVKVPDIGNYTDVPVIEVLVKAGDHVDAETPLITLESDKATMEVPSPQAGTIKSMAVKVDDTVSQGSVICILQVEGAAGGAEKADAPEKSSSAEDSRSAQGSGEEPPASAAPAPAKPSSPKPTDAGGKPGQGGGTVEVKVPDIGNYTDVPVIEVLVKVGDAVEAETPLITLESDKATMEVPAPEAGTIKSMAVKVNDAVSQGSLICVLQTGAAAEAPAAREEPPASAATPTAEEPLAEEPEPVNAGAEEVDEQSLLMLNALPSEPIPPPKAAPRGAVPHASPSIRKYARELGADLAAIKGSGPRGRILREDVQGFVKRRLRGEGGGATGGMGIPPIPPVDFAQFGPVETQALRRIRKISAAHLHRAWLNLPHVTQTEDADITDLEDFRHAQNSKRGVKLTLLPFLLKAVCRAIDEYPEFASSLTPDGQGLVMKHYRHIGFAADTENGLLVPVIRDVDKKGVVQLAKEAAELAKKARAGKLSPDEMKGGVFSISSLGGIGGSHFTPIINAPEVAILGVSRAVMQPRWDGSTFQPRLMLPLSLSYDHRVIDGAYAARFVVFLSGLLGDLRRLLL